MAQPVVTNSRSSLRHLSSSHFPKQVAPSPTSRSLEQWVTSIVPSRRDPPACRTGLSTVPKTSREEPINYQQCQRHFPNIMGPPALSRRSGRRRQGKTFDPFGRPGVRSARKLDYGAVYGEAGPCGLHQGGTFSLGPGGCLVHASSGTCTLARHLFEKVNQHLWPGSLRPVTPTRSLSPGLPSNCRAL